MKTARKILLIIIIIAVALFDLLIGVTNYNDRGSWFEGLGAMLADIWLIPAILGLLLGVWFGLEAPTRKLIVRAAIISCVTLIVHGLISAVIFIFTSSDIELNLDALWLFPLWSLGVGICAVAAGMIITLAIAALVKYIINRRSKPDEG